MKTYEEMMRLPTYGDRLLYLRIGGEVGKKTFGDERWLNQKFYTSYEYRRMRDYIIVRDNGCDLADPNCPIPEDEIIIIHHIKPITIDDIRHASSFLLDPNNLVCCSDTTHKKIHYGYVETEPWMPRIPNDTCPWK